MIPANAPKTSLPLQDLNNLLPDRQTPWNVSLALFNHLKAEASDQPFKLCEVLNSDPEANFILKYFEHQKPAGYSIKRVVCIHNPDHTQMFESTLKNMEREASNPFIAPKGKDEEPKADRARALTRWEAQASQFSPVEIKSSHSRQSDKCSKAKVLPLWHGSSPEVCQSICSSGFTYFGKQHYFDESASKGNTKNTDIGYFGSGIYFSNSAQYAAMYSSGGHLILAWVSMREPYPVVNDVPHPEKGSDMKKLKGQRHYQNYNAHFIPVASIRPQDSTCLEYYPCYKEQPPAWDEFVVFEKAQTLPRFWIELGVDFPKVALSDLRTVGELLTLLLNLLDKSEVQNHANLAQILQAKADLMHYQTKTTLLSIEDLKFLQLVKQLFNDGKKLNSTTMNMLLKTGASSSPIHSTDAPMKPPSIPAIILGKDFWAKHLGDVGTEPPLPHDIDKILATPCSFWHGKKVRETHVLVLIPQTVNGQPLTIKYLGELVRRPTQGNAIKNGFTGSGASLNLAVPTSYWALMTRDVIEGSRMKSYSDQQALIAHYNQQAKTSYEIPTALDATVCISMVYVCTGARLYSNRPETYTLCQDRNETQKQIVIGALSANTLTVAFCSASNINQSDGIGCVRKFLDKSMMNQITQKFSDLYTSLFTPALPAVSTKPSVSTSAFGVAEWKKYIGDVGVEPPLPSNIDNILVAPCPFSHDKKVSETHVLVLVPQTVNGQPLTLKLLGELVQKPLQGNATKYARLDLGQYEDPPVAPKSHWVLMTRDVIKANRIIKSFSDQQELITQYRLESKIPYEIPKILDAAVCIFMEYIRSGTRLYANDFSNINYILCQEMSDYRWKSRLAVGAFSSSGLCILPLVTARTACVAVLGS